jgi:hypothetical protein
MQTEDDVCDLAHEMKMKGREKGERKKARQHLTLQASINQAELAHLLPQIWQRLS